MQRPKSIHLANVTFNSQVSRADWKQVGDLVGSAWCIQKASCSLKCRAEMQLHILEFCASPTGSSESALFLPQLFTVTELLRLTAGGRVVAHERWSSVVVDSSAAPQPYEMGASSAHGR